MGQPLNKVWVARKPWRIRTLPMHVVLLSVVLTFSFTVLILSTLAGLQLGNTLLHPNPFVASEAVWPGQSIASLSLYARQTPQGYLPCLTGSSPRRDYLGLEVRVAAGAYDALSQAIKCADFPNGGGFRALSVTMEGDKIQQLEFFSDVLPKDVLLLYWGIPDSITQSGNPQLVQLTWDRRTFSAMAYVVKSDSVVKLVTLTARE